uniref:probable protein phosphatase 2C 2 n=1 Tax=Erigeron canadensis TaxID=72917 RepID=UPI001CB8FABF|nr:probable protein phosphatase 2C 2 [Erigeron canadensis]
MINIVVPNSPVFSPSSSFRYKSSSPECLPSPVTVKLRHASASSALVKDCNEIRRPNTTSNSSSTTTDPKRKRQLKLDIPVVSSGWLTSSLRAVEDPWKEVEVDGDGFSVYCKKGARDVMEDRFKSFVECNGQDNKKAFFGVFDGHGGSKAAEFAAENLYKNILAEVEIMGEVNIIEAIKQGYINTDSQFLDLNTVGGSCCLTAIVRDRNLVVSNAGDCRAVVSNGGTAMPLTSDHRPSRQDEKQRIESLGGYVDYIRGVPRVLGSLAVSRGIGDQSLKQWITAEPESNIFNIVPEFEFLIMASDGLWEKVSNQEAIDLARPFCVGNDKLQPALACKKLVELSLSRGSIDDASVMIVQLGQFC